jgi:hypothetical protein
VFGGGQQFISPGNYLMTWSLYYMNGLEKLKIIIQTDVLYLSSLPSWLIVMNHIKQLREERSYQT